MKKLLASLLVAGLVFTTPLTSLAADNTNLATTEKTITATFSSNARSQGWWRKSGNRYWFQFANGGYARNVIGTINGVTYAFDSAGWMATGWVCIDGYWYYCNSNGAMQFGWKKIGGSWYYVDPQDGYMYAGNVLIQTVPCIPDGIRLVMAGIISTIMAWLMAGSLLVANGTFSMDIG